MTKRTSCLVTLIVLLSMIVPTAALAAPTGAPLAAPVTFTILHTNDFHGQLVASGSNPGLARVAAAVDDVRGSVGAGNVLLVDGGDEMQGSLLSNLQKGASTIAAFNALGYDVATLGNHEFDWGQATLLDRTTQASYAFVSANIVRNDTGNCGTAGWTNPAFATPFVVKTVAGVRIAFIGVSSTETPIITIATATQGLCFKDPADAILHYYDTAKAQADLVVVLSHLGFEDGGYGYGIPVYGDKTLANRLQTAGKYVPLIIGGHSHTNLATAFVTQPVNGRTVTIAQAGYNGRNLGRVDMSYDAATGGVAILGARTSAVSTTGAEDAAVKAAIDIYANEPAYLAKVNQPIGYSAVDLPRFGGKFDNMMGTFVDDAVYNYLNGDANAANDVDIFFNNAGGIRTDRCYVGGQWTNDGCTFGLHEPALLTYGDMFTILPYGNATVVGTMTGAQILQVLNQAPLVSNGVIQPAGLRYRYFGYAKPDVSNPTSSRIYAWGAFDYCVIDKVSRACDPLDLSKSYKVGTNEFLAPGGGDGYGGFKYMANITYWGDMLDAVDAYVSADYGTAETAYKGPNGDGTLDTRIIRDGTDSPDSGTIHPITILHHNDSHGNLAKGAFVGYTQLATLIKQEKSYNPQRTLLLDGGDQIQGDAMMYFFKSAPSGYAADGTPLPDALKTHPMMAVMNSLGYDAMTLGNHEFNFGSTIFKGVFAQAGFPVLGANVTDNGSYGLAAAHGGQGVQPYVEKTLDGMRVAVLGITNHRVPNYELPSNIVGLTFGDPLVTAQTYATQLRAQDDVVIALTHIGFTEDPKSVEVDKNVDTNMAAQVSGLDAIIGSHSHTNPVSAFGAYKFLPTIVAGPNNTPVIINQAYRYNNYLGEVVLGMRARAGGGYEVASRVGQYLAVTSATPEDPETRAIVDPYVAQLNTYNNKVVGKTTAPIDTLKAYTEETNGANLQADAAVWELAKNGITDVDFHLSGAMTNKLMASGATPANPFTLKISDMFAGMPYENSLVTLRMNGPQLKAVLERAYRNYYYYKYVPGFGGYSYYTTCMIDINSAGRIFYRDTYPTLPDGNNVVALVANGKPVDFNNAGRYYKVSTVNYLAAGSCNFNDGGTSLWPLNQIVDDTQYYVRDAVIDYITAKGTVSPKVEGRLLFGDTVAPVITINTPTAGQVFGHPDYLTLSYDVVDGPDGVTPPGAPVSGLKSVVANLDGKPVADGLKIDLYTQELGSHTLSIVAVDYYGNSSSQSVTFSVVASVASLKTSVERFYQEGQIDNAGIRDSLLAKLATAQAQFAGGQIKQAIASLGAFVSEVRAQTGKHISAVASARLILDTAWAIANSK